jgi:hypothetical protein
MSRSHCLARSIYVGTRKTQNMWYACVTCRTARMLAARGRMRDYHRVVALARQASTQLQALGMVALARQALQLCETFQIDGPRDVSYPSLGLDKPGVPAVGILLHMAPRVGPIF